MAEKLEPSRSINEAKERASKAIFDAVAQGMADITSRDDAFGPVDFARTIRELAFAYRLAAGGAQPGSVDVSK